VGAEAEAEVRFPQDLLLGVEVINKTGRGQGRTRKGKVGQDRAKQCKGIYITDHTSKKARQDRTGQGRTGQGKGGQDKTGQEKAGQERARQGRVRQGFGQGTAWQDKTRRQWRPPPFFVFMVQPISNVDN
jgi:hypothetical protein